MIPPESSSEVVEAITEVGVDRTQINRLSDQGKKLKLIAHHEFLGF
jgi:hypothetical protein